MGLLYFPMSFIFKLNKIMAEKMALAQYRNSQKTSPIFLSSRKKKEKNLNYHL